MLDIHATVILVYGCICKRIPYELLVKKIENSIINNVIGFFDKNENIIQQSV